MNAPENTLSRLALAAAAQPLHTVAPGQALAPGQRLVLEPIAPRAGQPAAPLSFRWRQVGAAPDRADAPARVPAPHAAVACG